MLSIFMCLFNLVLNRLFILLFSQQIKSIKMSGSSVPHYQSIDQHLKNEFHQICFNPAKKDVLHRLTTPTHLEDHPSPPQAQLSNRMLREYMGAIYEHYGIEDPIKREFRLAKRSLELPAKPSPEKSLNQTQISESDRLTRTKRRLISLKDSFKQDSSEIIYTSQLQEGTTNLRESHFPFNRSRVGRQIGYRTKEKMHFKTLPRDEPIRQTSRPVVKHQFVIQKKGQARVVVRFNNSQNPQQISTAGKEVPVVFRYCPMCEVPVLDCNTTHHQSVCGDFQKAFTFSYSEIQRIIQTKIMRMEEQIQRGFLRRQGMEVASQFTDLKQSVALWMEHPQGNTSSLQKVKQQFHKFACDTYDKINKLSWFKRLLKTVASKRSLEGALRQ